MRSDQVHIDADIVRAMIFDQFPEYLHERIEQLGSNGTVNAIDRIGSSVAAGNIRQLQHEIEHAFVLSNGEEIRVEFRGGSSGAKILPLRRSSNNHLKEPKLAVPSIMGKFELGPPDRPHRIELITKATTQAEKRRTCPNRRASE
jgi:transcriptional regulator with AAA-type ATPase domain